MTNKLKHWMLRYYLWIAAALLAFALLSLLTFAIKLENSLKITIIGVPFSFVFFVQKQKLQETRLFKELFQEFNARYDRLNADLNRIRNDHSSFLIPEDRTILYRYFDLCAEEHLFYRMGYIPDDVWRSWHQGMTVFLNCPRIRKEWDDDPGSGSYYGLTFSKPPPLSDEGSVRIAA